MISFVYQLIAKTVGKSITWLGEYSLASYQLEVVGIKQKSNEME